MYRYAQIDINTGMAVGDSYLSGEVELENMIPISDDFDLKNKKYVDGEWISYSPTPVEEPITQEEVNATILLNQATILTNQENTDEVLSQILLNQFSI